MSFNVFLIILISFFYPFMIYLGKLILNKILFFDDDVECIETFRL